MMSLDTIISQNRQLRERIEELEETVRQLEEAAVAVAPLPSGIQRLTKMEEVVLRFLLGKQGVVSRESIYFAMYRGETRVDIKIVDVMVHHLRKKLVGSGIKIQTDWGRGYFVGEKDDLREALVGEVAQLVSDSLAA